MADSIKSQLEDLEAVGRVSVSGKESVHSEFGFGAMRRDEDSAEQSEPNVPEGEAGKGGVAEDLDVALTRLRARASIA